MSPPESAKEPTGGNRPSRIRGVGLGLLILSAFWIGWVGLTVHLPMASAGQPSPGEWVGVMHVHSQASDDASTPVPQIAEVAAEAGLDFVLITDHNSGRSGAIMASGVLMALSEEASTDAGHLLVLGAGDDWRDYGDRSTGAWQNTVALARQGGSRGLRREEGALVFLAHPEGPNEWRAPELRGVDGMEIWNADMDWRSGDGIADWSYALASLVTYPIGAMAHLLDRPDAGLARYDDLLSDGPVASMCALDVHQNIEIIEHRKGIPFPTFRQMFALARQHVLVGVPPTGDPREDALILWTALAQGRSYCAFEVLAGGSGMRMTARSGGASAGLGEELAWAGDGEIQVGLPPAGEFARSVLYRNGERADSIDGPTPRFELSGPGVYRLEVILPAPGLRRGWKPWILTNPIYVNKGLQ